MRLIAAVAADDDLVLDDERRGGDVAAALLGIVDADLPDLAAGFLIERDHEIVLGAEDDFAVADRDPAILDEIGMAARDARDEGPDSGTARSACPLAASSAKTRALAEMRYMTPSATIGVEPRFSV